MSEKIYIIKKLWIDSFENSVDQAVGYNIVGYTYDVDVASNLQQASREFTREDCWAITVPIPEFIYEEVEPYKP